MWVRVCVREVTYIAQVAHPKLLVKIFVQGSLSLPRLLPRIHLLLHLKHYYYHNFSEKEKENKYVIILHEEERRGRRDEEERQGRRRDEKARDKEKKNTHAIRPNFQSKMLVQFHNIHFDDLKKVKFCEISQKNLKFMGKKRFNKKVI